MENCVCIVKATGLHCSAKAKFNTPFCGRHQNCTTPILQQRQQQQQQPRQQKPYMEENRDTNPGLYRHIKSHLAEVQEFYASDMPRFLANGIQIDNFENISDIQAILARDVDTLTKADVKLLSEAVSFVRRQALKAEKQGVFTVGQQRRRAYQQATEYPKWQPGDSLTVSTEGGSIRKGDAFWEVTNWRCWRKGHRCKNPVYRNYFMTTKELFAWMALSQSGVLFERIHKFLLTNGVNMMDHIDEKITSWWELKTHLPAILKLLQGYSHIELKNVFDPYYRAWGNGEEDDGKSPLDLMLHFA